MQIRDTLDRVANGKKKIWHEPGGGAIGARRQKATTKPQVLDHAITEPEKTVFMMLSPTASSPRNDDGVNTSPFCLRGIEGFLESEAKERRRVLSKLYETVLEAQSIQRDGGIHDSTQLAGVSEIISQESRKKAFQRALVDALEVHRRWMIRDEGGYNGDEEEAPRTWGSRSA